MTLGATLSASASGSALFTRSRRASLSRTRRASLSSIGDKEGGKKRGKGANLSRKAFIGYIVKTAREMRGIEALGD